MANTDIFRAYDIRGVYPEDIDGEMAYKIGNSFAQFLLRSKKGNLKIVVGRDGRNSSLEIYSNFSRGITDTGVDVIDIGFSTTPMLYFAVAHYNFDGGAEITASHNLSQYNGFKLTREKAKPISGISGLLEIKELTFKDSLVVDSKGKIVKKDVLDNYITFILEDVKGDFEIVIDTANGVAGIVIAELLKRLPFKVYHIFPDLDGDFPNHPPDPLVEKNLESIKEEIKKRKTNLGIAFDGDGDRIIFLDEKANAISADILCALIAEEILKENPGEKIYFDLRSSNIVPETIKKAGGIPIMGRVGHSFIKERMRKDNIIFAGEVSGHYYSRKNYFYESPFLVLFQVLKRMSESNKKISELIKEYQKYFKSEEINFEVEDKEKALKRLEKKYKTGKISHLDGLRIDFSDWWFSARLSNTEPLLRLVVEANNEDLLNEKRKEISDIIMQ